MNAAIADRTIPASSDRKEVVKNYFTTEDIVDMTLAADRDPRTREWMTDFAETLRGRSKLETARNIWNFIKTNIRYKADPPSEQIVKSPPKLWSDRVGDCKSYSVFTASILQNLGIRYAYRFVSFNSEPRVTHVYIIVPDGSREIIIDAVYHKFDAEKPYTHKRDYMRELAYITGIGSCGCDTNKTISGIGSLKRNASVDLGDWSGGISDAEIDLLIARDRMKFYKENFPAVNGIGELSSDLDESLVAVNTALAQIRKSGNDPEVFEANMSQIIDDLDEPTITGRRKKKKGKILKKIANVAKKVVGKPLKVATKVFTAIPKAVAKVAMTTYLPNSGLFFIYLFADEKKLPAAARAKRKKQVIIKNFVVKNLKVSEKQFMGLVRNGILKKSGKEPEVLLGEAFASAGKPRVGAITIAALSAASATVLPLLNKLVSTLSGGKRQVFNITKKDMPDLRKDFESLSGKPTNDAIAKQIISDAPITPELAQMQTDISTGSSDSAKYIGIAAAFGLALFAMKK